MDCLGIEALTSGQVGQSSSNHYRSKKLRLNDDGSVQEQLVPNPCGEDVYTAGGQFANAAAPIMWPVEWPERFPPYGVQN